VGLPGKTLDGADQRHEGAKGEDDVSVDVVSHYRPGHTKAVGVSSPRNKVAEIEEGEKGHEEDDLRDGF